MADCPNCGFDVPEGVRICPNCGFDTGEGQAERVRELREKGVIHPGRLGAEDSN
ncbi:MAG: zinc-ribbon domain, partial [Thermoleophilaceae bacterium]|nr:zinc-ribbon domain [Thermoleophilaceae bacterium]